jgi:type VI secretion system protein ImpM
MYAQLPEDFLADTQSAPGWFGKIPALGDFATRRLPELFTERWDAWLTRGMESAKGALGSHWLDTYLSGPLWRFALAPGVIDERYWLGVLMPSVDRVGRYFPLTIVAPSTLPPGPALAPLETWFERVAMAALHCLTPGASLESLEIALAQAPVPSFAPIAALAEVVPARLPAHNGLTEAFTYAAAPLLHAEYRGASFWWARIEADPTSTLSVQRGLPDAAQFVRLLDGTL